MSRTASPLRYPGGKACLYDLTLKFIEANGLQQRGYAEPYSGGCGLALSLLFSGHVKSVHLNDVDRSIWAFWTSVTRFTDQLVKLIETTPVTVDEWRRQRAIQSQKAGAEIVELGFSTFFLNRTSRSGIVHSGGVIGGIGQEGAWKIDCRYNKSELISRIRRIEKYKNRIFLYNEDAEVFLERCGKSIPINTIFYIDPPYFEKGAKLYKNSYKEGDHSRISEKISALPAPWFLTYDNVGQIRELYQQFDSIPLDIGYSVQIKRRGSEILIVGPGLELPTDDIAFARQSKIKDLSPPPQLPL